jgi:hypothetical protein
VSCTAARIEAYWDGGRAYLNESGKAVWRSSQHDFEDAAVFCPTGLSVQRTTGVEEARSLHGMDRHASRTAMALEGSAEVVGWRNDAAAGGHGTRDSLPLKSPLMRSAGIVAGAEQRVGC